MSGIPISQLVRQGKQWKLSGLKKPSNKSQDTNIGIKDLRAKTQLLEENNRDWKITNKAEKYLS